MAPVQAGELFRVQNTEASLSIEEHSWIHFIWEDSTLLMLLWGCLGLGEPRGEAEPWFGGLGKRKRENPGGESDKAHSWAHVAGMTPRCCRSSNAHT